MPTVILFNGQDTPINMGQSQQPTNLINFLEEHKDKLVNYVISEDGKLLTFEKGEGESGYAILITVPEGFQN